jgi:hypothetical protein
MSKFIKMSIAALAALALWSCVENANKPANTTANTGGSNSNTTAGKSTPTADALVALESKAFDEFGKKDGKWFEGFLNDRFVMFSQNRQRLDKAATIKMVSEDKCTLKSIQLSEPTVTTVSSDVYVLTTKADEDYECEGKKMPSPVRSATVYVRSGDAWKAAYHNEVLIVDPKDRKPGEKPTAPPAKAAESPKADALTDSLMAIEKEGWEAWKSKDTKKFDDLLGKDMAAVGLWGDFSKTKADVVKAWTDPSCSVSTTSVTDGQAIEIAPGVAILTFKGSADGKCGDLAIKPVWGTTVYFKEGDTWKAGYFIEMPA